MAEMTYQVSEKMAKFIDWVNSKGQEEIQQIISDRLAKLKEHNNNAPKTPDEDGFVWDDGLEKNDGVEQWKHGGDCNECRRRGYCLTQCRPNKLLKKIATPFLYAAYLEEHPEIVAEEAKNRITPDDVLKMVGAN